MDSSNLERIVNKLWSMRHTHDDDTGSDLEQRIIRIETGLDPITAQFGAHVHASAETQEIAVNGDYIEFSVNFGGFVPSGFDPSYPVKEFVVQRTGYYDAALEFAWVSWNRGGSVELHKNGVKVWPPGSQWTAPAGRHSGLLVAKGVECSPGDELAWFVDHGGSSAQDLEWAYSTLELVDRTKQVPAGSPPNDVEVAVYDNENDALEGPYPINLPTSQAGDLLLMVVTSNFGEGTINTPTGWTLLALSPASNGRGAWFKRVADGSEGATVDLSTGGNVGRLSAITWRVRSSVDYSTEAPAFDDANASFTVPPVAANHGSARYISFVAVSAIQAWDWTGPAGYTPLAEASEQGGGQLHPGPICYLASDEILTGGTVSPGDITFGATASLVREYRIGHVLVKVADS
ncbi:MAG TPA: hypothetical protein VF377_10465 [Acidimicrobiia bacterium]